MQEARKSSGFEVSDRIHLAWHADAPGTDGRDVAAAIQAHAGLIAEEVLAVELVRGEPAPGWFTDADLGLSFGIDRD